MKVNWFRTRQLLNRILLQTINLIGFTDLKNYKQMNIQ
jgi:hypothetical protein